MRHNLLSILLLSLCLAILGASVGCGDKVVFVNAAPSSLSLTPSRCFVETGGTILLSGGATDDDGDSLTFTWKATKGTFTPSSATGPTVTWHAPAAQGSVLITMAVTDEVATSYAKKTVVVCLPFPAIGTGTTSIGSPGDYFILLGQDPLRISSVATVKISPGVTIVVDRELGGLEVYGNFIARGTATQRIKFQGNSCSTGSGLWGGIYLEEAAAQGIFSNTDITMSKDGIRVNAGASLTADTCEIYNNDTGISVLLEGSQARIDTCRIWENGTGLYLQNSTADIRKSSIRYSGLNGVELSYSLDATPVAVESCTVANSGLSGFQLGERAAPEIHHCSIFSNGQNAGETNYGIKLASYTATDSVHAEYNYWGVGNTTASKIAQLIYDKNDNPDLAAAYVSFTPWLNTGVVMSGPRDGENVKGSAWARLWR